MLHNVVKVRQVYLFHKDAKENENTKNILLREKADKLNKTWLGNLVKTKKNPNKNCMLS